MSYGVTVAQQILTLFVRTDELWCNGSTTDSDSVCLGSNPGSSTKDSLLILLSREFFIFRLIGVRV